MTCSLPMLDCVKVAWDIALRNAAPGEPPLILRPARRSDRAAIDHLMRPFGRAVWPLRHLLAEADDGQIVAIVFLEDGRAWFAGAVSARRRLEKAAWENWGLTMQDARRMSARHRFGTTQGTGNGGQNHVET